MEQQKGLRGEADRKEEGDRVLCEDFVTYLEREPRSSGYFCFC